MKNLIRIFSILMFFHFSHQECNAQWVYGGGLKFNSNKNFKALGINGKIGKDVSEKFEINTDIAYYLGSKATWSFDFDVFYRLFNLNDNLKIKPFAGINFTRTEVTNNSLSLGCSFRIPDEKYTYYLEPRWILDNNQFVINVGVIL